MDTFSFKPVNIDDIEAAGRGQRHSIYRAICEAFLSSGEQAVELEWQLTWPDKPIDKAYTNFTAWLRNDKSEYKDRIRTIKRGEHLYLTTMEHE